MSCESIRKLNPLSKSNSYLEFRSCFRDKGYIGVGDEYWRGCHQHLNSVINIQKRSPTLSHQNHVVTNITKDVFKNHLKMSEKVQYSAGWL